MNIAAQINEVTRRVEVDQDSCGIALERSFSTTAAQLWDACTSPMKLAGWFEPVQGDLCPGGRYRLTESGMAGVIMECEPPGYLHLTWEYEGHSSEVALTVRRISEDQSRLVLTHRGSEDEHWTRYGPAAGGVGWDSSLLALAMFLEGDPGAAPEHMVTWSASDEGHEFVRETAAAWAGAHADVGADPVVASQAAERTVAAYTTAS